MKRLTAAAVLAFWVATPCSADQAKIEYLKPPGLLNVPSFSQVTTASEGKLIFVSGQVSWDEKGNVLHPGDLEAQTHKTYENLKLALAAAGATFDDVVKFTVYVKNLDTEKWRLISKVRSQYLSKERPAASTMIGVTGLVYPDLLIEIEAYAVVDEDEEDEEQGSR